LKIDDVQTLQDEKKGEAAAVAVTAESSDFVSVHQGLLNLGFQ
jgi:hypothetical protein